MSNKVWRFSDSYSIFTERWSQVLHGECVTLVLQIHSQKIGISKNAKSMSNKVKQVYSLNSSSTYTKKGSAWILILQPDFYIMLYMYLFINNVQVCPMNSSGFEHS